MSETCEKCHTPAHELREAESKVEKTVLRVCRGCLTRKDVNLLKQKRARKPRSSGARKGKAKK